MLSLSKLLFSDSHFGDDLRYTKASKNQLHGVSEGRGPVVGWNYTNKCNLKCKHCYSNATLHQGEEELSTEEAKHVIDGLADFNVPVILFSGGEPLMRKDFFDLATYAKSKGIRVTLSTNGTLITPEMAERIKEVGVGYVGISLDGMRETNDEFRGVQGAYDRAIEGIRNCKAVGQRVGLRFTLSKENVKDIGAVMDVLEDENVERICFYHLVYSGRGEAIQNEDLSAEETREVIDYIVDRAIDFNERGLHKEMLLVDNHTDGPYLYLKYKDTDPKRAEYIYKMLSMNGGNRSGMAFANIDFKGNVHPDQFLQHHTVGNVREQSFKDIWTNMDNPLLAGLKDRTEFLDQRCKECSWLSICNGNFRARGEAVTGDFWGFDPACFLTEEERNLPAPELA